MMLEILWMLTLALLSASLLMGFLRLARGPRLPDRVIALDLITLVVMGFIIVTAVRTQQTSFLDAAIVLVLISFLGTVAFAYAIERRV